jgi:hypothetical protein
VAVSKKLRFEVFKRDGFRCVYCGSTPEKAMLRVDHVEPASKGGADEPWNLVTACFDCNAGKSDRRLEERTLAAELPDLEAATEHIEQLKAYLALQREKDAAFEELVSYVEEGWDYVFTKEDRGRIKYLLREFPADRLRTALEIAAGRFPDNGYKAWKYFHGILRNWREGR